MIKGSIYQEDVIILNLYEQTEQPQNRLSQLCIINILLGRNWETQHYRRRLQLLEGQAAIKSVKIQKILTVKKFNLIVISGIIYSALKNSCSFQAHETVEANWLHNRS